jgi:excisionase family DNA binding protein
MAMTQTTAAAERRLVDVKTAAAYAGVSDDTVRRWIAAGKLPSARRVGVKLIRLDLADIDAISTPANAA